MADLEKLTTVHSDMQQLVVNELCVGTGTTEDYEGSACCLNSLTIYNPDTKQHFFRLYREIGGVDYRIAQLVVPLGQGIEWVGPDIVRGADERLTLVMIVYGPNVTGPTCHANYARSDSPRWQNSSTFIDLNNVFQVVLQPPTIDDLFAIKSIIITNADNVSHTFLVEIVTLFTATRIITEVVGTGASGHIRFDRNYDLNRIQQIRVK